MKASGHRVRSILPLYRDCAGPASNLAVSSSNGSTLLEYP